ncbi:hypothetical protein AB0D73_10420 [Streptomyces sp. NPDC048215]|uniref:hypothetical protein n=1 Tax=Streptomyces sp. NPDC048215 TaxID=3156690 RepID=UPI0033C31510
MSTSPAPGPREPKPSQPQQRPTRKPGSKPPALIFDDPLDRQSSDDTDQGWGERAPAGGGAAADLARFLDEKPPHHV